MKNLAELLRTIEVVANHRYTGDVFISKVSGEWKIEFHKKSGYSNGVARVESGEGPTLEEALERACENEIYKAQDDLDSVQAFMKYVRPKR